MELDSWLSLATPHVPFEPVAAAIAQPDCESTSVPAPALGLEAEAAVSDWASIAVSAEDAGLGSVGLPEEEVVTGCGPVQEYAPLRRKMGQTKKEQWSRSSCS